MPQKDQRLDWLDWLRSAEIMLVLIAHTPLREQALDIVYDIPSIPVFFFVTGYLFHNMSSPGSTFRHFFRLRLRPLILAYALFAAVGILQLLIIRYVSIPNYAPGPMLMRRGWALLYGSGSYQRSLYPLTLWYLTAMITALGLFWWVRQIRWRVVKWAVVLIAPILAWYLRDAILPWELESALAVIPCLALGDALRARPAVVKWLHEVPLAIGIGVLLMGCTLAISNSEVDFRRSIFGNPIIQVTSALVTLAGAVVVAMKLPHVKTVRLISRAALWIFLVHVLAYWYLDTLFRHLPWIWTSALLPNRYLHAAVLVAITLPLTLWLFPLVNRLTNALRGRRLQELVESG